MRKNTSLVLLIMLICCLLGTTPVKAEVDSIEMHRLYNPHSGEHFYTGDTNEKNHLASIGWNYEGIGWYSDEDQGVPLYRQYNPNEKTGTHNYTTSKEENDFLVSIGWRAEGIGWYGLKDAQDEPIEVPHIHDWVAEYETVHHEEKGHNEQYVIKEAWTESVPIYENQIRSICNTCGADITGFASEHAEQHMLNGENGAHHTEVVQVQTGTETIEHPEEYGTRYVIDEEAYDELVLIGYTCSCGAKK